MVLDAWSMSLESKWEALSFSDVEDQRNGERVLYQSCGILSLLICVSASVPVEACMLGPQLSVVSDEIGTKLTHHLLSLAHLATTNVGDIFSSSSFFFFYSSSNSQGYYPQILLR